MHRTILLAILMTTALAALPASAGHDDKGPRWDRYQHYDFRDRHYRARPGHPHGYHPDHGRHYRVIERHHYYYPDRHRHHHRHDHDVYTIIGGAILLNEILHH